MAGLEHGGSFPGLSSRAGWRDPVQLQTCQAFATCPACGKASDRVHSRYQRKLDDLPWEGQRVVILLRTRKFFCDGDRCRGKIFTVRLPSTVARYARRSCR